MAGKRTGCIRFMSKTARFAHLSGPEKPQVFLTAGTVRGPQGGWFTGGPYNWQNNGPVTRQRAQGGLVQNSGKVRRNYKRRNSDGKNLVSPGRCVQSYAQIYCGLLRFTAVKTLSGFLQTRKIRVKNGIPESLLVFLPCYLRWSKNGRFVGPRGLY